MTTIIFRQFDNNKVRKGILPYVKKDRLHYAFIYDLVESYCSDHNMIISDLRILTNHLDELDNLFTKEYKIYCTEPLRHANNLTNEIHKNSDDASKKFIRMKTIVENEEFSIEFDTRLMCSFMGIKKYKSMDIYKVIEPISVNRSGRNILLMPYNIEIIDVLNKLYSFTEYDLNLEYFTKLIEIYKHDKIDKINSDKHHNKNHNKGNFKLQPLIKTINQKIFDFIKDRDLILIGNHTIHFNNTPEKIQLLSEIPPNTLLKDLKTLLKDEIAGNELIYKKQDLNIPKDFRIEKYTFYIKSKDSDKPILDCYNNLEFELIPYVISQHANNDIKIAHPYVLLRFAFIDLWIIKFIYSLNIITKDVLLSKINTLNEFIDTVLLQLNKDISYRFLGIYREYSVDKRLFNLTGNIFQPYYPQMNYATYGKYRIV